MTQLTDAGVAGGTVSARGGESGAMLRFARALVATAIVWVPAALYVFFVGAPGARAMKDPMLLMFGGLAFIYVPIALAVATTDASFGDAANPFTVFALAGTLFLMQLAHMVYPSTFVLYADYRFDWGSVFLVYKNLYYNADSGNTVEKLTMGGPAFGVNFRW